MSLKRETGEESGITACVGHRCTCLPSSSLALERFFSSGVETEICYDEEMLQQNSKVL